MWTYSSCLASSLAVRNRLLVVSLTSFGHFPCWDFINDSLSEKDLLFNQIYYVSAFEELFRGRVGRRSEQQGKYLTKKLDFIIGRSILS